MVFVRVEVFIFSDANVFVFRPENRKQTFHSNSNIFEKFAAPIKTKERAKERRRNRRNGYRKAHEPANKTGLKITTNTSNTILKDPGRSSYRMKRTREQYRRM